ncbi:UDP-N-acetylmuramoylalanyl-D-glutamate-2,6-diaminopimelate ligase [Cutibacterium acnes JCM 18918]|nr:UDP-N-acetylmuramoylalanyl-D-glutamate-2,6-diaminopimelate ligase [Cutibacterium acnes JCM 18918]
MTSWQAARAGAIFDVSTPSGERTLELSLPGEFNVRNAAMALAMLEAAGLAFDDVADGLCSAQVPGRMERVDLADDAPTASWTLRTLRKRLHQLLMPLGRQSMAAVLSPCSVLGETVTWPSVVQWARLPLSVPISSSLLMTTHVPKILR